MAEHRTARRRKPQFELIAGNLCLDFINTLDNRPSDQPKELLTTYADLVSFAEDSGVLNPNDGYYLRDHASSSPQKAQDALHKAIELREAMCDVLTAVIRRERAPEAAFGSLSKYVQEAAGHSQLVQIRNGFEARFEFLLSLESILWPIALAAAELLTSRQLRFIRACLSPTCQWLFLDTSKNHRRRWCDMKSCGNRAKARRFYKRQKTS